MIQIHGKTILSMEFKFIIKVHDSMIQIHGKTILSMEFKSIINAHDSNTWQNNVINVAKQFYQWNSNS